MSKDIPYILQNNILSIIYKKDSSRILNISLVCKRWFKYLQLQINSLNLTLNLNQQLNINSKYSLIQTENIEEIEFNLIINRVVFNLLSAYNRSINNIKRFKLHYNLGQAVFIHNRNNNNDINTNNINGILERLKSLVGDHVQFEITLHVGDNSLIFLPPPPNHSNFNITNIKIIVGQQVISEEYLDAEETLASITRAWKPNELILKFNEGGLSTHSSYRGFLMIPTLEQIRIETDFVELNGINQALASNHLESLEFSYLYHYILGERHGNDYRNACFPWMDSAWRRLPDTNKDFLEFCSALASNRTLRKLCIHNFCKRSVSIQIANISDQAQLISTQFSNVFNHNITLTYLQVDNIPMLNEEFFLALHDNRSLKTLILDNGTLDNDHIVNLLGNMLEVNQTITYLSITANLEIKDCQAIAKALTSNQTLHTLDISFCPFQNIHLLYDSLLVKKSLQQLLISPAQIMVRSEKIIFNNNIAVSTSPFKFCNFIIIECFRIRSLL